MKFEDWGLIDYKKAWDRQEEIFKAGIDMKLGKSVAGAFQSRFILCEHPHVYTLGKNGDENNLLIRDEFLKSIDATYYRINRGGDITYHGPGQIVGYPILDLEEFGLHVKEYVFRLEQVIINTLSHFGIEAARLDGATGVWLDADQPGKQRKICAIGIRASRYITMHGFAFNVNTELNYFNHIHPCGFVDKGVTSMQKELGRMLNFEDVKNVLKEEAKLLFIPSH